MNIADKVLGWILMACGLGIIVLALGELILRVLAAIFGLMMINYALRLLGARSSVQGFFMSSFSPFGNFNKYK